MKKSYITLLIGILISCTGFYSNTFGQGIFWDNSYNVSDTSALMFVDKMPEFHGYKGRNSYERARNFIDANLRWPTKDHLNGKVFISFVVERDGSLSNFRISRGFNSLYDAEALRVAKLFPKWKPGSLEGVKERVVQTILVNFLSEKDKELLYKTKSEIEQVSQKDYSENSVDIAVSNQKITANNNYFASLKKPGDLTFLDYDVIVPELIRNGRSSEFYDRVDRSCLFYLDQSATNVFQKIDPQYVKEERIDSILFTPDLFIKADHEIDFKGYNIKEFFNDKWALHLALFQINGSFLNDLGPDVYLKFNNTAVFTLQGPTWSRKYKAFLMNGRISFWKLDETIE